MLRSLFPVWALSLSACWVSADYDELLPSYHDQVVADHPVVYLRLGESAGSTAHDEMGHADGTYPTAALTYGMPGALEGDGNHAIAINLDTDPHSLQGIALPAGQDFAGTAAFTVELWGNPTAFQGGGELIDHNDWSGPTAGWNLRWEDVGISFERYANGTTAGGSASSPALAAGTYHHVVGVYDGAQILLYVDAALQMSNPSTMSLATTGGWTIGKQNCNYPCTQDGFVGSVDEVAVYDYALPEARIQAHHRAGIH